MYVVVAVVVAAALVATGFFLLRAPSSKTSTTVDVQNGVLTFWGNGTSACLRSFTERGVDWTATGGKTLDTYWGLPSCPSTALTVSNVSVSTPGFSLVSVNTPLTIPKGSGSFATLNVVLTVPNADFTGNLYLFANLTAG